MKIMQKVFAEGMVRELGISKDIVDRIFPCLQQLLDLHLAFLRRLRERQNQAELVHSIGDILLIQFSGVCWTQECDGFDWFFSDDFLKEWKWNFIDFFSLFSIPVVRQKCWTNAKLLWPVLFSAQGRHAAFQRHPENGSKVSKFYQSKSKCKRFFFNFFMK